MFELKMTIYKIKKQHIVHAYCPYTVIILIGHLALKYNAVLIDRKPVSLKKMVRVAHVWPCWRSCLDWFLAQTLWPATFTNICQKNSLIGVDYWVYTKRYYSHKYSIWYRSFKLLCQIAVVFSCNIISLGKARTQVGHPCLAA